MFGGRYHANKDSPSSVLNAISRKPCSASGPKVNRTGPPKCATTTGANGVGAVPSGLPAWYGEFCPVKPGGRIARWPVTGDGSLLSNSDVVTALDGYRVPHPRMQGAVSNGDGAFDLDNTQNPVEQKVKQIDDANQQHPMHGSRSGGILSEITINPYLNKLWAEQLRESGQNCEEEVQEKSALVRLEI